MLSDEIATHFSYTYSVWSDLDCLLEGCERPKAPEAPFLSKVANASKRYPRSEKDTNRKSVRFMSNEIRIDGVSCTNGIRGSSESSH